MSAHLHPDLIAKLQTALVERTRTFADKKEIVAAIDTLLGIGGVTGDLETTLWEHRDRHSEYVLQAEYVILAMETLLSDNPHMTLLSAFGRHAPKSQPASDKAADTVAPAPPVEPVEAPKPVESIVEPSKVEAPVERPKTKRPSVDPVMLSTIAGLVTGAEPEHLMTAEIYMALHKQDSSVEPRVIVAAIVEMKRKGTIEEVDGRLRLKRCAKTTRPTLRADVSNQDISSIRTRHGRGDSYQKLADAFGISRGTVANIVLRKGAYE